MTRLEAADFNIHVVFSISHRPYDEDIEEKNFDKIKNATESNSNDDSDKRTNQVDGMMLTCQKICVFFKGDLVNRQDEKGNREY